MARFSVIAMAIFTFMAGLTVFNEINDCYCGAYCDDGISYAYCYTDYGYLGTGHRLVNYRMEPIIEKGTMLIDDRGIPINISSDDYNATIDRLLSYKAPGQDSFYFGSFFTFGLNGIQIIINTFFLPLKGFSAFLGLLGVPAFITFPVFTFIFLTMIIGIIEFITSKTGWF